MPSNRLINQEYTFRDLYPPVSANSVLLTATNAVQFDETFITQFPGSKGILQRLFRPGTFVGENSSGVHRPLPRTRMTVANAADSAVLNITGLTSNIFVATDVVKVIAPSAQINLALTWADADTLTITVAGNDFVHTVSGFTDLEALAVAAAADLNNSRLVGSLVRALAEGDQIHLYALDMLTPHSLAVTAGTAGNGTAAIEGGGSALAPERTVGTISAVNTTAADLNTLTLGANAAIRLPVDMPIGVSEWQPVLGLVCPQGPPNPEWDSNTDYGVYDQGNYWRDRLPYWDGELSQVAPKITLTRGAS